MLQTFLFRKILHRSNININIAVSCFLQLLILPSFASVATLSAQELETLVVGKEGLNYYYKNLFRRTHDYYETFTIQGQQLLIEEKPVSTPNIPQLMPDFSQRESLMRDFKAYAANDFVELYFQMQELPAKADTLYILNRLLQMKTMTGIEYFSTRQQEMTTYITDCYIVDKAKSRKELAPPQFHELPKEPVRLIIRQDDNRFTATWYEVTIRIGQDGSLRMTMDNVTPMYVQFIFYFKALDTGKVRHEIIILPNRDSDKKPEIYAISQINNERTQVMGIPLDLGNSFNRRMSAVQAWISQRIYN